MQEEAARLEEQIAQATKVWSCEILPQWDAARKWRKTRTLWWAGLPPSVRGQVWKLAIGNFPLFYSQTPSIWHLLILLLGCPNSIKMNPT